ncbi:MAG: YczE/YyaS/YitT family protein [Suipraeoptans sp.]
MIKNYLRKSIIYAFGLLVMAFGVTLSINSDLGVSPINSLPYIVSFITQIDLGTCVTIVFSVFVFIQIIILRRDFALINLTQLIFSALFGYFVDFAKWIVGDFSIPTYPGKLAMLLVSIVIMATGACFYMGAGLIYMPMEGLTYVLSERLFNNKPFHDMKVITDCAIVVTSVVLSLVFLGRLEGVREGTIICALLIGRSMKFLQKLIGPSIEKILS